VREDLTWGESSDPRRDWLAASTRACDVVHGVNPSLLVVVEALCWNFDLRLMMKKLHPAAKMHKLVYGVHVFENMMWNDDDLMQIYVIGIVSFLESAFMAVLCYCSIKRDYAIVEGEVRLAPAWMQWCATAGAYGIAWMVTSLVYMSNRTCTSFAMDAEPVLICAWVITMLSFAMVVHLWLRAYTCNMISCGIFSWLTLYFATGLVMMTFLQRFDERLNEIWALQGRQVPVLVSAVGTATGSGDWNTIWNFVARNDLDFAYWAFNGQRWSHGMWTNESFGLMTPDYAAARQPALVEKVFGTI
jgi:hypothetical protein